MTTVAFGENGKIMLWIENRVYSTSSGKRAASDKCVVRSYPCESDDCTFFYDPKSYKYDYRDLPGTIKTIKTIVSIRD